MVISFDRNPKYSIYFLGAVIIEIMNEYKCIEIDFLNNEIKIRVDDNINIDVIYYSLDWLFLLDLIKINDNKVELCY